MSRGNDGANVFTCYHLLEIAFNIHVENVNGKVVLLSHHGCSHVHNFETALNDLVVGDGVELSSCWILLGIGGVDAIDTSALEHYIGLDLNTTQRAASVGGEEWVTSST